MYGHRVRLGPILNRALAVAISSWWMGCHFSYLLLLWVLDRLVDLHILTFLDAAASLEIILKKGSWLPRKECEARLRRWGG